VLAIIGDSKESNIEDVLQGLARFSRARAQASSRRVRIWSDRSRMAASERRGPATENAPEEVS
jgi:hypothetical protein